ncbi:MAG: hypothetical protein IJ458_00595 [Clostridia bacterium]|nr:hypothetical protein [Clostridia bacterium]
MYKMYSKLVEKTTQEMIDKSSNVDDFIYNYYNHILEYKTSQTVGFEGDANIPYVFVKCLKDINIELANILEKKLNIWFEGKAFLAGDTEAFSQLNFGYGKEHLRNTLEMINNYQNSLGDGKESVVSDKLLAIVLIIEDLLRTDKHSKEKMELLSQQLQKVDLDLQYFCDNVEQILKQNFVQELNQSIQETKKEIESQPTRIKRFNGQDFNLLIHTAFNPKRFLERRTEDGFSTSLIDNENICCYGGAGGTRFAFYDGIEEDKLLLASARDASTDYDYDNETIDSFSIPDYIALDKFKNKTKNEENFPISEISLGKGNNLKPNAIVCYDVICEDEYKMAKQHGLDIILIETKYYDNMKRQEDTRDFSTIKTIKVPEIEERVIL